MLSHPFTTTRNTSLSRLLRDSSALWSTLDTFEAITDDFIRPYPGARIEADETDTVYTFTLALPGFKREHLTVEVLEIAESTRLSIRAAKNGATGVWTQSNGGVVNSANCRSRTITLPSDADSAKVEAKLEDGLLTLSVGKVVKPSPRKVTVN